MADNDDPYNLPPLSDEWFTKLEDSKQRGKARCERVDIAGGLRIAAGTVNFNTSANLRVAMLSGADEIDALRAALAVALDGWELLATAAADRRAGGPDSGDRMKAARIAELREKFLDKK